jgi:hypothetical protein
LAQETSAISRRLSGCFESSQTGIHNHAVRFGHWEIENPSAMHKLHPLWHMHSVHHVFFSVEDPLWMIFSPFFAPDQIVGYSTAILKNP